MLIQNHYKKNPKRNKNHISSSHHRKKAKVKWSHNAQIKLPLQFLGHIKKLFVMKFPFSCVIWIHVYNIKNRTTLVTTHNKLFYRDLSDASACELYHQSPIITLNHVHCFSHFLEISNFDVIIMPTIHISYAQFYKPSKNSNLLTVKIKVCAFMNLIKNMCF